MSDAYGKPINVADQEVKGLDNIEVNLVNGKLLLTIDLEAKGKLSGTGRSTILATTNKFAKIPGLGKEFYMNVLVGKKV